MERRNPTELKKRALACNYCRRSKRKCNGQQPCSQCLKKEVECEYSVDNRTAKPKNQLKSVFKKRRVSVAGNETSKKCKVGATIADSEQVMKLIIGEDNELIARGSNTANGDESVPGTAELLGGLFGGAAEIGAAICNKGTKANHLKVHPSGGKLLYLSKEQCDKFVGIHEAHHRIAADAFLNDEFKDLYDQVWTSKPPTSSSDWLYIYSALGVGSTDQPAASLEQVSHETQSLYLAAAGLVGLAVIEGKYESAVALALFGHFSMLVGEFMAQPRFCRLSFHLLVCLRYNRAGTYTHIEEKQRQGRLRFFWHVYSICYLHSLPLSAVVDVINRRDITAPWPSPPAPGERDNDYHYLILKLELTQLYGHAERTVGTLESHESVIQFMDSLQNSINSVLRRSYESVYVPNDPVSQMYCIILQSLSMHVLISTYRPLKIRSLQVWRSFEKTAISFIQVIHIYAVVQKRLYASVGWHISQHIFTSAIMLIYCKRMRQMEGHPIAEDHCDAVSKAYEILNVMASMLNVVHGWIQVLDALRANNFHRSGDPSPQESQSDNSQSQCLTQSQPETPLDESEYLDVDLMYEFDIDTFLQKQVPDFMNVDEWASLI